MPDANAHTMVRVYNLHLILTLGLFGINVMLTHIISKEDFPKRLRYIGHEMAFLALGLAAVRIFSADPKVVLASFIIYLVLWVITLWLTQIVIDGDPKLKSITYFTIAIGGVSVYFASSELIERFMSSFL